MSTTNTPVPGAGGQPPIAELLVADAAVGPWALDPANSQVEFHSTSMWGLAKIHGRFGSVRGVGTVAPGGTVSGTVTVDAATLDTKMKKRDEHLRSKDFFDVAQHPTFTFTVEKIEPQGADDLKVFGTLTIRDVSRPLQFTAHVTEATAAAITLTAELVVERSQFGMAWRPMKIASLDNRVVATTRFERVAL